MVRGKVEIRAEQQYAGPVHLSDHHSATTVHAALVGDELGAESPVEGLIVSPVAEGDRCGVLEAEGPNASTAVDRNACPVAVDQRAVLAVAGRRALPGDRSASPGADPSEWLEVVAPSSVADQSGGFVATAPNAEGVQPADPSAPASFQPFHPDETAATMALVGHRGAPSSAARPSGGAPATA